MPDAHETLHADCRQPSSDAGAADVFQGQVAFALLVVIGNLLADMLYSLVDPRIRFS